MIRTVHSFGAGTQTTALAILQAKGELPRPDAIVFADTGDEKPETYEHLRRFADWLSNYSMTIIWVKRDGEGIVPEYTNDRLIPMRTSRSCTDKFKIRPVRKWLRRNGHDHTTARSPGKPHIQLGISIDEWTRVSTSDVKWCVNEHPLIDNNIDRAFCEKLNAETLDWPVPPSGCMACPFQSRHEIARAARVYPDRVERIAVMEERAREKRPDLFLIEDATVRQHVHVDFISLELFPLQNLDCPRGVCGR